MKYRNSLLFALVVALLLAIGSNATAQTTVDKTLKTVQSYGEGYVKWAVYEQEVAAKADTGKAYFGVKVPKISLLNPSRPNRPTGLSGELNEAIRKFEEKIGDALKGGNDFTRKIEEAQTELYKKALER